MKDGLGEFTEPIFFCNFGLLCEPLQNCSSVTPHTSMGRGEFYARLPSLCRRQPLDANHFFHTAINSAPATDEYRFRHTTPLFRSSTHVHRIHLQYHFVRLRSPLDQEKERHRVRRLTAASNILGVDVNLKQRLLILDLSIVRVIQDMRLTRNVGYQDRPRSGVLRQRTSNDRSISYLRAPCR